MSPAARSWAAGGYAMTGGQAWLEAVPTHPFSHTIATPRAIIRPAKLLILDLQGSLEVVGALLHPAGVLAPGEGQEQSEGRGSGGGQEQATFGERASQGQEKEQHQRSPSSRSFLRAYQT